MAVPPSALTHVLTELGIDEKFHALLAELSGGEPDYLPDVEAEDLAGSEDAAGLVLTAPVARGLVRRLRRTPAALADRAPPGLGRAELDSGASAEASAPADGSDGEPGTAGRTCHVTLLRSEVDASLVRCGLRAELVATSVSRRRQKLLVVLLDRSGSMAGATWRRVVEALISVLTDSLLADPCVSVALVLYSDAAEEVQLPARVAELREMLFSRERAPRGGTCFGAAFGLAQRIVERELKSRAVPGVCADTDVAVLVFTDGEDTSVKGPEGEYGVRLVDKDASLAAARAAGDVFREALVRTGCPSYVCFAAFGVDHNPDQCQYLSDRYHYINRGEVLAEVIAAGLGAMLSSAGQCSLHLVLPQGVALDEPLPRSLPLDAGGRLDHHVWLRAPAGCVGRMTVEVDAGGAVMRGAAMLEEAASAEAGSFRGHLMFVDATALQLRRVARELCGGRPSAPRLADLRAQLADAKERLQPTRGAAAAATGRLCGRAALRERLAEVEALRERLSYALGQFDERDTNDVRTIGAVAVDAILRDAGQHVPQGPAAAALARRAEAGAALAAPEALSAYGRAYTADSFSCCDAQELAEQGDCLFFQLVGARPAPGGGFFAAEEGVGLVSHEAFALLSRGGQQPVKAGGDEGFTHLGLPLFATVGHFLRVKLVLPEVLARLTPGGIYVPGASERQLLSLLGHALAAAPRGEAQAVALLHKARAVRAVLTSAPAGEDTEGTLLDSVVAEAARFLEDPSVRAAAPDLYAVAGAGVLAEGWEPAQYEHLGDALAAECLRRRIAHALRAACKTQRLCLAWSLLGPADGSDAWLDRELPCAEAGELQLEADGFDPFAAPSELEDLEAASPRSARPRASGSAALLAILSARPQESAPPPTEWAALRLALPAWARAVQAEGGLARLWQRLDALMTVEDPMHEEVPMRCAAALRLPAVGCSLRGAFTDAAVAAKVAVTACLPELGSEQDWRTCVAAALRGVVERRTELVRKYPIIGAAFPRLELHSRESVREIWGSPAEPLDPALHHKAMLRVFRRTMRAGISMTTKEALADKEYRRRGGRFTFPSPLDTFVRGLHRRTADLHEDWRRRLKRETAGGAARDAAVTEMLLRLRWDDSDDQARAKLSQIVARIWDGLEGLDLSGSAPLSSALWLDDSNGAKAPTATDVAANGSSGAVAGDESPADAATTSPAKQAEAVPASSEAADEASGVSVEGLTPAGVQTTGDGKALTAEAAEEPLPPASGEAVAAAELPPPETRVARDGQAYTLSDFLEHYGDERGMVMWQDAAGTSEGVATRRAEAARAAMDDGLEAALEAVDQELRQQMAAFCERRRPGSRMKLPLSISAKQRKALHLWAEMQGVEHQSFGYRGRRRLHLSVPGEAGEPAAAEPSAVDDDFDFEAWAAEEQEQEEEEEEEWH